jgi:hypothetical protein
MKFNVRQKIRIKFNQFKYQSRTSEPFLSGDAFRQLADVHIDSLESFKKELPRISSGQLIFCQSELLEELIAVLDTKISGLSLIAGNSDRNFEELLPKLSNFFDYLFLQNSLISDNKRIFTLPIGIENLRLGINGLPKNLTTSTSWIDRPKSVLIGPFSATHKSRTALITAEEFNNSTFTFVRDLVLPKDYAALVKQHKFVLCPRGNGIDTHRFWETLYRGAIPIVIRDKWSQSLALHNLPMIEVDEFSIKSIGEAVEAAIESNAFETFEPSKTDALWIDYWKSFLRK